ncbi:hypothetical protein MML63_21095 [Kosakonia sacchari]|uniref:hypothetical protein n=1 Tax=Kosakonia sacchari TaxID=1158459 RepID=UPI0025B1CC78|nr:hypothetical protein [Kosakonia sacchari]MDN2488131.1 hypothetical protein [Kosakonia sacchari]
MLAKTLTLADREALEMMPAGWFILRDVPSLLNRPAWRLERLVSAGVVQSRIRGTYPGYVMEYRVLSADEVPGETR